MIYLVKISRINFLSRITFLVVLCIGAFPTVLRADVLKDYLDLNPEVRVFSQNVGSVAKRCTSADCPTYPSVKLEVPEYIHSNLVTDIPVIRNGRNDVVIASIDTEGGIVEIKTKNTANEDVDKFPLRDGDKIHILYINEDGVEVPSVGLAKPTSGKKKLKPRRENRVEPKKVDRRKLQIDKIKENLPDLDPETIDIAIKILKNEFQASSRSDDIFLREKVSEKVDLINNLISSGELTGYDIWERYPRLKFFNELNDFDKSNITDEEVAFFQQVNRDLENLSASIMRTNPEVLIKGLYKKLINKVQSRNLAEQSSLNRLGNKPVLSFSEHIFVADMMKSNFDEVFGTYLDEVPKNVKGQKKYHPNLIDPNFLNERLRLQEEVILYLSLFKEEVLENEKLMESFSDQLDPNIGLTLVELQERYRAQTLIDRLLFINEEARLKGIGFLETTTPIEDGFGTREVVKNVNLILEEFVDDILYVIDQEVNGEQKTFWENLRDFLELPNFNNNSDANFETSDFYDFEGEEDEISEQLEDVLQRRQELQDLAAIAAVMGYPVLGPP